MCSRDTLTGQKLKSTTRSVFHRPDQIIFSFFPRIEQCHATIRKLSIFENCFFKRIVDSGDTYLVDCD